MESQYEVGRVSPSKLENFLPSMFIFIASNRFVFIFMFITEEFSFVPVLLKLSFYVVAQSSYLKILLLSIAYSFAFKMLVCFYVAEMKILYRVSLSYMFFLWRF